MSAASAAETAAPDVPEDVWTLRMRDLCESSGLQRQAIHFYIKEGLLPPGRKTGRNMAYYGDIHVERLAVIQRLQHERFLPLRAIKALLDGGDEQYTEDQRRWLRALKAQAADTLARGVDAPQSTALDPLLARTGVKEQEVARLSTLGVMPVNRDADGSRRVSEDDAWVLDLLAELRELGFTDDSGFGVNELEMYEQMVSAMFASEVSLLTDRLTQFDAAQAASMVERVMPLVHRFITRYHQAKVRRFFAAME